jgi:hypothetical protein
MAYKGVYGVLYCFCAGCPCHDLDPYPPELWYVHDRLKFGREADGQYIIRTIGHMLEDYRTDGCSAGKW